LEFFINIVLPALKFTQPLIEISARNISWWVKVAGAYGWQPYHHSVPIVLKSGSLNLLEPSGLVQARKGISLFHFYFHSYQGQFFVPLTGCSLVITVSVTVKHVQEIQ